MPFQTAQDGQSQRRSNGMWLGNSGSSPYPSPQLQHVSRSSSLGIPQRRHVQLRGALLSDRTCWETHPAAAMMPEKTDATAERIVIRVRCSESPAYILREHYRA